MKVETNLNDMLEAVSVPADWVGIREVYESQTPRKSHRYEKVVCKNFLEERKTHRCYAFSLTLNHYK